MSELNDGVESNKISENNTLSTRDHPLPARSQPPLLPATEKKMVLPWQVGVNLSRIMQDAYSSIRERDEYLYPHGIPDEFIATHNFCIAVSGIVTDEISNEFDRFGQKDFRASSESHVLHNDDDGSDYKHQFTVVRPVATEPSWDDTIVDFTYKQYLKPDFAAEAPNGFIGSRREMVEYMERHARDAKFARLYELDTV